MALQSQLFRGDPTLEAAAESDRDHILPGSAGLHVGKIQTALIQLDGAAIQLDSVYGPATASAVLAFKRKRKIINQSRQTEADNIVGIMTMAALDREMLAKESIPTGPVQVRPVNPIPRGGAPTLRLGFKIDVDFPVFPNGNIPKIRLAPKSTGKLEIVNGKSGRVRCTNVTQTSGSSKISFIFDPDEPSFIPATRLNPEPRGPLSRLPLEDGGTIRVTNDPFPIQVDAFQPGNAFIDAATATSANTLAIEVRAPKLNSAPGFAPPTKTRPGSKFISAIDSEAGPNIGVRGNTGGRPVNPKGSGRKINIFGARETPGFDDYTSDLKFSDINNAVPTLFMPWTEDTDPTDGVQNGKASDICIRDSPVFPVTIAVIRRIASPGCRLTFASTDQGVKQFSPVLKSAFSGAKIIEEFSDAIVMELP